MQNLYPPLEPFDRGTFQPDDIHTIYYEQSGNPEGVPVVFLHGGPGAGSGPKHRQFFDPAHYRIIIFDQRGSGQSKPTAELRNNTTQDLINDMEYLRKLVSVEKWHVFGGSWGSTLSLAYAIAHPNRVLSLTLRGIFLMTQREIDWFLSGIRAIYPEAWEFLVKDLTPSQRKDILGHYYALFTHQDHGIRLKAAQTWSAFEASCCALIPRPQDVSDSTEENHALSIASIEAHYFMYNRFNPDNYLLANIDKIRHIPAVIVQGRYDVVCPIETAYDLHRAWPEAQFVVVPDAGHSSSEPGITSALIEATNKFRSINT